MVGTNKRYGDSIDREVEARQAQQVREAAGVPEPAQALRDWSPPWPPIQISDCEWIIMRNDERKPAGLVRMLKMGPRRVTFYRVVTWAPTSEGRTLVGYYPTLSEADRSIRFDNDARHKTPGVTTLGLD